jgi:hypothetical protein
LHVPTSSANAAASADFGATQTAISIIANAHSVVKNPFAVSMKKAADNKL